MAMRNDSTHIVLGTPIRGPYPDDTDMAWFGMGCFWGAEKMFWTIPGIYTTAVGYAGGQVIEPSYEEVCSGNTGHAEVVQVVFQPKRITLEDLLRYFWENHDPTQGMRQGNDIGSQYRSIAATSTREQSPLVMESRERYQAALTKAGFGAITTEILVLPVFYFAEDYHQQYLARHPHGYCGLGGTAVSYPAHMS